MSRRALGIVIAATLIGLLFATVTTSGGVGLWIAPDLDPAPPRADPVPIDATPDTVETEEEPESSDERSFELPSWLTDILSVLAVATVIFLAIIVLRTGWERRPRLRWGPRATGEQDFDVLPDVAVVVMEEAAAQRAALLSGEPRNAIVRCWLQLEQDVAAAGLARDPADTSAEFTERVLAEYSVDAQAIREFAALYREARFSEHPLDEAERRAALDALDRLHGALARDSEAAEAGAGETEIAR